MTRLVVAHREEVATLEGADLDQVVLLWAALQGMRAKEVNVLFASLARRPHTERPRK